METHLTNSNLHSLTSYPPLPLGLLSIRIYQQVLEEVYKHLLERTPKLE